MSLLDTLRKNLSPELLTQVTDALGDDFNFDVVPRSRLNKVISQRDEARLQLKQSTQAGDDDDGDDDGEGVGGQQPPKKQKKLEGALSQKDLDEAVRLANEAKDTEMKNLRLRFAATEKLRTVNAVDPDLLFASGLLDLSKIVVNEQGSITGGLDEQITELTKNRPYLFTKAEGAGGAHGTGRDGGTDFTKITSREEFLKMPTDKQLEFKNANPDVFKSFLQA